VSSTLKAWFIERLGVLGKGRYKGHEPKGQRAAGFHLTQAPWPEAAAPTAQGAFAKDSSPSSQGSYSADPQP